MRSARQLLLIPVELLPHVGHSYALQRGIAKTEVARFLRRALIGFRSSPPCGIALFYGVTRVLVDKGLVISRDVSCRCHLQVPGAKSLDHNQTVRNFDGGPIICGTPR